MMWWKLRVIHDLRALRLCNPLALQLPEGCGPPLTREVIPVFLIYLMSIPIELVRPYFVTLFAMQNYIIRRNNTNISLNIFRQSCFCRLICVILQHDILSVLHGQHALGCPPNSTSHRWRTGWHHRFEILGTQLFAISWRTGGLLLSCALLAPAHAISLLLATTQDRKCRWTLHLRAMHRWRWHRANHEYPARRLV